MKDIAWLEEIGKDDAALAGGKGAQLGELKKAGFNVPDGFVITANVYGRLISRLYQPIQVIFSRIDIEKAYELEKSCKHIRELIVNEKLPETVEEKIVSSCKKLGGLVAVRSSGTAEDQKESSFAGQMATFLNVTEKNLIKSIKCCMASLFSDRAIAYLLKKKISYDKVYMAVVVQKMVSAEKAGVAFSVNPVNRKENELVIEAGIGFGDNVVSGRIIPDNYVIDKKSCNLKEKRISKDRAVLNEQEIRKIAVAVKKIERHYKFPQDVEWAIDENNILCILQSRPVTILKPEHKHSWRKILAREYGVQYTELSIKCLSPLNKGIVPFPFYEQVYIPEDGNEACYIREDKWGIFVSSLKKKYFGTPDNCKEFERRFVKAGSEYVKTSKGIAVCKIKGKSNSELRKLYLRYLTKNLAYGPFIWMQFVINNFFAEKAKEIIEDKTCREDKKLPEYIEAALKPGKKAASIQLSEIAAKWKTLGETEKVSAYNKFKWLPCLDIHNRAWTKEEFFTHINGFKLPEKKSSVSYERLIKEIKPSKSEKQIIDIAKRLSYLKDLKDDFRRKGIFYAQTLFQEIAARMNITLEDFSYLTEEEIIEFLEGNRTVLKELIKNRYRGFAIYFNEEKGIDCKSGRDVKPAIKKIGIIIPEGLSEEVSCEIRGMPASQGSAKGTVTIVKGVSDLKKVRKGAIIVAVTTHPDYVPAMQKAAAIVTDEGGVTSHAAIIARELGLPCIVGAKSATKSLKDGDNVEVNAGSGIVRKLKR